MAVLHLFDYSAGYSSAFSDVSVENLVKKKRRNTFRELLKLVKVVATLRLIIRVVGYTEIKTITLKLRKSFHCSCSRYGNCFELQICVPPFVEKAEHIPRCLEIGNGVYNNSKIALINYFGTNFTLQFIYIALHEFLQYKKYIRFY